MNLVGVADENFVYRMIAQGRLAAGRPSGHPVYFFVHVAGDTSMQPTYDGLLSTVSSPASSSASLLRPALEHHRE